MTRVRVVQKSGGVHIDGPHRVLFVNFTILKYCIYDFELCRLHSDMCFFSVKVVNDECDVFCVEALFWHVLHYIVTFYQQEV